VHALAQKEEKTTQNISSQEHEPGLNQGSISTIQIGIPKRGENVDHLMIPFPIWTNLHLPQKSTQCIMSPEHIKAWHHEGTKSRHT
jgi:hypothetical protein